MEMITRQQALAEGRTTYYTGKPCPHGHVAPRVVSSKSCVECAKGNGKRHYKANREVYVERATKRIRDDPEGFNAANRRRRQENPERYRAREAAIRERDGMQLGIYNHLWRLANPERFRALSRAKEAVRRTKKTKAGGSHTADDLARLFELQRGRCADCHCKLHEYHADHIKPVARGGSSDMENIQLLCPPCNRKKHASDPIEHAQRNGRLL